MLPQDEFEEIINDDSKTIEGDILWDADEDHSPAVEFRAEIISEAGYPLFVKGSHNPFTEKLTYALIHRGVGRVYALDLGQDHRNPDGQLIGEKHKHRWDENFKDKAAYAPTDITAPATDPVQVWQQFCREARILHNGEMKSPPPMQLDLFF